MLDFFGFTYYSTFVVFGYQFKPTFNSGQIHASDIIFAIHALFLTSVHIVLLLYYPRKVNNVGISSMSVALLTVAGLTAYAMTDQTTENIVKLMGFMVTVISLVKFVPQARLNCKRPGMEGWSLAKAYFDLTGSAMSLGQLFMDQLDNPARKSLMTSDFNFAKFSISSFTLIFSIVFICQRHWQHRDHRLPRFKPLPSLPTDSNERALGETPDLALSPYLKQK